MKKYTIVAILMATLSILLLTGFQCASQELTSARLYIKNDDWKNAEKWLAKETEKNPTNAEAWWLLGYSRMQLGNNKDALTALDASLKISNEFADKIIPAKRNLWSQSLNQGVNSYNKSVNASPDSSKILLQNAVESYQLALAINPDSAITYQYLAVAYHALGNFDQEINTFKEALKRMESPQFQIALINLYLQKAQNSKDNKQAETEYYNNAIDAIKKARQSDPENADILDVMINIYVAQGRANEAKPYIMEAITKDPNRKEYQYDLGVLLLQSEDSLQTAISYFEKALQIDPKYDVALQNAGVAYMRLGDKLRKKEDKSYLDKFKKAVGYFERLTEVKPTADSYDLLVTGYANANMLKEAEEANKKADSLRKK